MNASFLFCSSRARLASCFSVIAIVAGCASNDTPKPAGGGLLSDQVYGTWTCDTPGQPTFKFDVVKVNPNGPLQQWHDRGAGGGAKDAYVHLTLLYLTDAMGAAYRDFSYTATADAPDVLVALDESDSGGSKYHCTKP